MFTALFLVIVGYLVGSVASAVIASRLMGLPDPRYEGSRNPGATNVLRLGSRKAAALTLFGDLVKGLLPVLLGRALGGSPAVLAVIAVAAFMGHLFPVFFRFRGGKGVATGLGAIAGLAWPVAVAMIVTWIIMALIFRYSSLAALTAALLAPLYAGILAPRPAFVAAIATISLFVVWRHRSNLRNLFAGTEDKMGAKSKGLGAGD